MPICAKQWKNILYRLNRFPEKISQGNFSSNFSIENFVVTKKELCRQCLYCEEQVSIEHTFLDCSFTKDFLSKVAQWFNNCNQSSFKPTNQEFFFEIFSNPASKECLKKLTTPCFLTRT